MSMTNQSIFAPLLTTTPDEDFTTLLQAKGLRIERIVSNAHATPPGQWYDQDWHEWVLLIQGAAGLMIEGESEVILNAGDYLYLPAHCRHRVNWTSDRQSTIWLAIHFDESRR